MADAVWVKVFFGALGTDVIRITSNQHDGDSLEIAICERLGLEGYDLSIYAPGTIIGDPNKVPLDQADSFPSTSETSPLVVIATIETLREQAARLQNLMEGTYYTRITELWETRAVGSSKSDYDFFQRPLETARNISCLHYSGDRFSAIQPYRATIENMTNQQLLPADAASSARTSHTIDKDMLWPCSIFGTSKAGQVAHLLPTGPRDAITWWFIPEMLFGVPTISDPRTIECAIHGAKPKDGHRVQHTGVKHFVTNKARIVGQYEFMDKNPCLLIIPILTVDQVKSWNGGAYDAIVSIDSYVATQTEMTLDGQVATDNEVETARQLLLRALRAIHYALGKKRPHKNVDDGKIQLYDEIQMPTRRQNQGSRVRKVSFCSHAPPQTGDTVLGHPAPDPMLLVSKAAVVYSTRHGQRLAAGAEPQDDWSEGDYMELEQYLEWQDYQVRPPDDLNELARRLGQPNGYQDSTVQTTLRPQRTDPAK
jgi:hypothetical protein